MGKKEVGSVRAVLLVTHNLEEGESDLGGDVPWPRIYRDAACWQPALRYSVRAQSDTERSAWACGPSTMAGGRTV